MFLFDQLHPLIVWDSGGGGGGDPPADPPKKDPDPDSGSGGKGETFNQDDIDRIVGREKKKAQKAGGDASITALLEKLGVKDADELTASLKTLTDLQAEDKSDLEKATTDLETATGTIAERDTTITTHEATIASLTLQIAFNHEADKLEIMWANPQAKLDAFEYLEDVTIEDDGKVSGLDKAIKKLQKDRAHLFNTGQNGQGSPLPAPGGAGKPTDQFKKDAEQFVKDRAKS